MHVQVVAVVQVVVVAVRVLLVVAVIAAVGGNGGSDVSFAIQDFEVFESKFLVHTVTHTLFVAIIRGEVC